MKTFPFYFEKTRYEYNPENQPYQVTLGKGNYLFECVGASGGGVKGGRGAKVSAFLSLSSSRTLYIYIGGEGEDGKFNGENAAGGYNGGGIGGKGLLNKNMYLESGSGGGGATDIRLRGGAWDDDESLNSRVLVSGGGGGDAFSLSGGHGGKLKGLCSEKTNVLQSYCGGTENDNVFGHGENGADATNIYSNKGAEGKGGGGGGYYGGLASQQTTVNSNAAGGGGSSYVSGDVGFSPNSEIVFTYTYIKDGSELTYKGNGYAIISQLLPFTVSKSFYIPQFMISMYFVIL